MWKPLARLDALNGWVRAGIVAAGYGLAFTAGWLAAWAYDARMAAQPYDTSGGMYAAGEAFAALGAFLVTALPPTLLALWFLRRNARFWFGVGAGALAFAVIGLLGILLFTRSRSAPHDGLGFVLEMVGLAQLLGVPLWAGAFVLFAFLAPTRPARRLLVAAVGVEILDAVCAAVHWFSSRPA